MNTTPGPTSVSFSRLGSRLPGWVRFARLAVGALLLAGIAAVIALTYRNIERELRSTLDQKLTAVLSTNVHVTRRWLAQQHALVGRLASDPHVIELLSSPDAAGQTTATLLDPLKRAGIVGDYAWFAADRKLAWASSGLERVPSLGRDEFERALENGTSVSVFTNTTPLTWKNRVVALARVGPRERPLGFLALCINPDDPARGLSMASWGRTGRTFAFDAAGAVLSGEGPRVPAQSAPAHLTALAHKARHLGAGEFEGAPRLDVDGEVVTAGRVGAYAWLPKYGLGIATEVERTEAYESVALLRRAFVVLVVLVGSALLGFVALGRWTLRVREESVLVSQRLGRLARTIQPLSAALEHDPGAVVLIDDEGTVVYANSATRQILGVDGPLIGKSARELFERLHTELREAVVAGVEAIVAQKPGQDDETLLVTSRPLRIEGKPHFMYTLRPVTREVRRQEVDHWKKLIRVLSHELNNSLAPITSLVSSARTLNDQNFHDPKLAKILDAIVERTTHLVSFLESYRSIARLPRPTPVPVDWEKFLDGVRPQHGFRIEGTLPDEPGYFDPIQLERVLVNTLDNAAEAGSPPGAIAVSVESVDGGAVLEILDRGAGMTEPVLRQAMLPFFSTKQSGTGVGLALSREIVEAHGGQMTLANREGGGLVVSIFLPKGRQAGLSERNIASIPEATG